MHNQKIVTQVYDHVQRTFAHEGSGHDWWHIYRVWKTATRIAETEGANIFVVELAALLHDIADWKFHGGDDTVGPREATRILTSLQTPPDTIRHVTKIISDLSFKGAGVPTPMQTLEGKIVQDADRLEAIGAIGIARTFAYGGHKSRAMHNPHQKPRMHTSKESYARNDSTTINHFYEKLLLLKDRMNTDTAKRLAEGRHAFMEDFLERFYLEWEGKC